MVYGVSNPTFVGTNIDASWLTDNTQALQTGLENNQPAHLVTTSLLCGALAAQGKNALERVALFVKCQIFVNGALILPSFFQGIAVDPKMGTLLKTADTVYQNIAVTPFVTTKDKVISGATWVADKGYKLNNFVMTTLSPLVPSSTIFAMFKASRASKSDGLATKYVLTPIVAGIFTNFVLAVPGILKDTFGTPDLESKSAFGQSVASLANAWTNTGRMIVDCTNYLVEGAQSTWKRMRA